MSGHCCSAWYQHKVQQQVLWKQKACSTRGDPELDVVPITDTGFLGWFKGRTALSLRCLTPLIRVIRRNYGVRVFVSRSHSLIRSGKFSRDLHVPSKKALCVLLFESFCFKEKIKKQQDQHWLSQQQQKTLVRVFVSRSCFHVGSLMFNESWTHITTSSQEEIN